MKSRFKKMLSLVLTLLLAVSLFPVAALPAGAETTYAVGDIIEFGGYPQSRMTDANTVAALNAKVKDADWVSYGYYSGDGDVGSMEQGDWMKYCDIYLNGQKYRGVTFSQYRPAHTYRASSAANSLQDDNGYTTGTNYWFLWETLRWRVLDPSAGLVLCENIIDSQAFQSEMIKSGNEYYIQSNSTVYANNYAQSTIRNWLNNIFYQTAFTSTQQAKIKATALNNDAYDYSLSDPIYTSTATNDKIFLLSGKETINASYGFDANRSAYDEARNARGTDYAKCQGLVVINNHSHWILRNAKETTNKMSSVGAGGYLLDFEVTGANLGTRPAFTFKSGIVESPFAVNCAHSELTYVNNGDYTHTAVCKTCDAHLYTETHESLDGRLEGTNDNAHRTYCGKCYSHVWIPHDQEAINRTVTGTCVTPTRVYYNCSFCGYLNTGYQDFETVPDRHVNTAEISETDSTCATPGYTAGVFCNDCQHYISGHVEKELAPHDWDYENAEFHWDGFACPNATLTCKNNGNHTTDVDVTVTSSTTYPDCEHDGETVYTASFTIGENVYTDPNTKTETLGATGHLHTTDVPETDSTCIAHGYTAGVWCNDCETWVSGHEEKPFADHTWDEGEITKPATCVAKGETTYACTVPGCGETKTVEDVAENPENHTGGTRTENEELVPGTCVAKKTWKEVVYCVSCGEPVSSTPKTGEKDPDNHVNTTEARESDSSCTAHGYTAGVWCGDCETWISGHEEKPLVRHSYVGPEWKWNGTASAKAVFACTRCGDTQTVTAAISSETVKEPTDTEAGKKVYTATAEFEGETYTDAVEKTIPSQGDGLCKWCGERHEGFFGRILGFFHSVAYFFAHLFGRK